MTARLPAALLLLALGVAAPAALAAGEDPCAPVDGVVPLMCQSGPAPAGAPALPRTGRDDLVPLAAGGLAVAVLGGVLTTAGRTRVRA